MARPYVIIYFLLLVSGIQAQENFGNLRVGLLASLDNNQSSQIVALQEYIGYGADYDQTNYRLGLTLEYKIWKDLAITTAFTYSNKDFTGTYYCMVCNFSTPPTPQDLESRFIEVPLSGKYYFLPGNFRIFGEAGINNLFPVKNQLTDKKHIMGMKLGGGAEYNFPSGIALQVFIDYNKNITNLFRNPNTGLEVYGFGIGILKSL